MARFCWLVVFVALFVACAPVAGTPTPTVRCGPRDDDPTGYLVKICKYVVRKDINIAPGSPERIQIRRLEERPYNGRQAIWVYLVCCRIGDLAIIDKQSGEVVEYLLGAQ
jgi:hypothetical protein